MIPGPSTPGEIQAYVTTLPASVLACGPHPEFVMLLPTKECESTRRWLEACDMIDEILLRRVWSAWQDRQEATGCHWKPVPSASISKEGP